MADQGLPSSNNAAPPAVESVLHVAGEDVLARLAPMFVQLVGAQAAGGMHVALATDSAAMIARLQGTAVTCHRFANLRGWRAWALDVQLAARCDPPPDVVHVWDATGWRGVQRWAWRAGIPLVVHILSEAALERLLGSGLHPAPWVITGSQAFTVELIRRAPQMAARCRTVVPAVAPGATLMAEREPDCAFSVLCVGQAESGRGLELLLEVVANLRRDPCDLVVAVFSSGPRLDALRRQARAAGVLDRVALLDDPWVWEKVLPSVDALVVPAGQRELSVAPLLAMALHKVVLSSRDQPAEWFVEDRTTWQFTPGSAVELAYLLSRAMDQPQQARTLTTSAAEYVQEHHAIRTLVEELTCCYAHALATSSGVFG